MADTAAVTHDTDIRPFAAAIPDDALVDMRRRIAAWRPPEKEPVDDQSQGVQLATMQRLADYCATEHDGRRLEAKHNALPQYVTNIDGLDIHFIHVKSSHSNAARLYWQLGVSGRNFYAAADVSLPAAVTVFADEYVNAPRSWTEQAYHNLISFNEADKGGHFAREQPQLFAEELRAAFRSMR